MDSGGRDAPLYGRRDARRYGKQVHGEGQRPAIYQPGATPQENDFRNARAEGPYHPLWVGTGGVGRGSSPDGAGFQPCPELGSAFLGLRPRLEWSGPLARGQRADGSQSTDSLGPDEFWTPGIRYSTGANRDSRSSWVSWSFAPAPSSSRPLTNSRLRAWSDAIFSSTVPTVSSR